MAEQIRLHYDPRLLEGRQIDPMITAFTGFSQEVFDDEREENAALLEYAARIGIQVVGEPPRGGANEYNLSSEKALSVEEQHDFIRTYVPGISIPETFDFANYNANPFYPMVAKRKNSSMGKDKYLIENPAQWEKLRFLLTAQGALFPKELAFFEGAETYYTQFGPDTFTNTMDFQRFIETPSDRNTSYRALVSSKGEVIASSLLYSGRTKNEARLADCDVHVSNIGSYSDLSFFGYLTHPNSYVYLGSRDITSNLDNGGSGIVLDPLPCSKPRKPHENDILEAHGISPVNPRLPEELRVLSGNIGRTLGRKKGIIVGIDWIQEQGTPRWAYLETNLRPGPQAFADRFFGDLVIDNASTLDRVGRAMSQAALRSLAGLPVDQI
jgi:hypothetical protein